MPATSSAADAAATVLSHARRAWPGIRREVVPALVVFWINLAACGLVFAALEPDDNWLVGLYWSAVTGSTTGFGDVLPSSVASMLLTIYAIASSWVLNLVIATLLIKNVLPEPHLFTDAEQRHSQAHDAVQTAHARYQSAMSEALHRSVLGEDPRTLAAYGDLAHAEHQLAHAQHALDREQAQRGEPRVGSASWRPSRPR